MIVTDPEDYRNSAAISFSRLRVFERCPLLYYKRFIAKTAPDREETDAMRLGSAAHCLILEGIQAFQRRYATRPATYSADKTGEAKPWNRNAKICQLWEDATLAAGKTPLAGEESDLLAALLTSVVLNDDARALLASGSSELAIRRHHSTLDIDIQGRLDWLAASLGVVVDLKTIENLDDMASTVETRSYYRQLAYYRSIATMEYCQPFRCAIIGVEKAEPRRCGVYYLSESLLELGTEANNRSLARLKAALDSGDWGGNPATVEIQPSAWLNLEGA